MAAMGEDLRSLSSVLEEADVALRSGLRVSAWTWPTGFALLDTYLGGGLRAGELCLLGGPQGLGKTTLAVQFARNATRAGAASVVFSYEHDARTMLERLLTLESGELLGLDGAPLRRIREALEGSAAGGTSLYERLAQVPGGHQALTALQSFGDRLLLHRSLGTSTDLATIRRVVEDAVLRTGRRPLVVVDYLQKVHVPVVEAEFDRVTRIVEGLKDLALELELPVLAIVAADKEGLTAGKRLRVQHLRGSSALAYEPDVVLILNDKYDVVARHHLVYDTGKAELFRNYAVLSIEKNRSGMVDVDIELRKRFDQSRFETDAQNVAETLVDERVYTE